MKNYLLIVALFISFSLFAQNQPRQDADSSLAHISDNNSSVVIHKDPRIDLLVRKQAEINEVTSRDSRRYVKGFRLMIINTNKREEALAAKTKIYTYFPELKAYLTYQTPYFKLKVGNFKERKDAEDFQKRLNIYFPKGVYVMNDVIEVKPEKLNDSDLDP
ncbi:MAG: SPOR domain-containing protein [Bacteroidota bacterium]